MLIAKDLLAENVTKAVSLSRNNWIIWMYVKRP